MVDLYIARDDCDGRDTQDGRQQEDDEHPVGCRSPHPRPVRTTVRTHTYRVIVIKQGQGNICAHLQGDCNQTPCKNFSEF